MKFLLCASFMVGLTSASYGLVRIINFETDANGGSLTSGAIVGTQFSSWGVVFTSGALSGIGWATNTTMELGNSADGTTGIGATSSMGNVLRSYPGFLAEDGDPSFRIDLPTGATGISLDFIGDHDGESRLMAFDSAGSLVDNQVVSDGFAQVKHLSVSASAIAYAIVLPGSYNDWVGVDNVAVTVVPEPTSLAALGLGGLCLLRKRGGPARRLKG